MGRAGHLQAPSHRILAMRRGERKDFSTLRISRRKRRPWPSWKRLSSRENRRSDQVRLAVQDSYKRLLSSSMETEIRLATKKRADDEAIRVFAENLRQLLLAPPLGQKNVLAIDPASARAARWSAWTARASCCTTRRSIPLHQRKRNRGGGRNGPRALRSSSRSRPSPSATARRAGRPKPSFAACRLPGRIPVVMVNESGASVYSASEVAREEFPDQDVTVRGAVSIGRRLMDPLAELVKIDPKVHRRRPVSARRGPARAQAAASTTWS